MKRVSFLLLSALLLAACGGTGGPGVTPTPATGTPVPTTAVPTPTDAGETPDGATSAPDPNAGACRLLTTDEVAAVVGEPVSVLSTTSLECTYSAAMGLPSVTLRFDSGESLEAARMILTDPEEITIAGNPAVFGEFMGHLLYVQEGDRVLVFQAIWGEEDREQAKAKLTTLAEAALPRFPLP